ncbi:MAG TPA: hypothetical protein VF517_01190 [Thermoleophilaceae bacterium]|jgi:hypothetical protein
MFPLLRTRAARVLDVAIEFATLGEYRLEDPIAPVAPARGATRGTEPAERLHGASVRPAARLVAPASAAAVRLRPAPAPAVPGPVRTRPKPASPLQDVGAIKQLALDFDGALPRPAVRTRGGAAPAAPQPCESPRR